MKIASSFGFKEQERRAANYATIRSSSLQFMRQIPPLVFRRRYSSLVSSEYLGNIFCFFSAWLSTLIVWTRSLSERVRFAGAGHIPLGHMLAHRNILDAPTVLFAIVSRVVSPQRSFAGDSSRVPFCSFMMLE
jgi:hypothetical protein